MVGTGYFRAPLWPMSNFEPHSQATGKAPILLQMDHIAQYADAWLSCMVNQHLTGNYVGWQQKSDNIS